MATQPVLLDFRKAIDLIVSNSPKTTSEWVGLQDALGRVPVKSLCSRIPQPAYDQSIRDGFVVADNGTAVDFEDERRCYSIDREIAAGPSAEYFLPDGKAGRIMTGALIPVNTARVIPFENCQEKDGQLFINKALLSKHETYFRRKGSRIGLDQEVVKAGTVINVDHLALLAETGILSIEVYRKVQVSFFCTGSELQKSGEPGIGMKISSNRYLLDGLISSFGATPNDRGIVPDVSSNLLRALQEINPQTTDVIVTTGGMGPGKYDLLEKVFIEAGGTVIYNSLNLQPGKSTLFGSLGSMLFFGLPGPPPAVRALFNELIRPALLTMQGVKSPLVRVAQMVLEEDIHHKRDDVFKLKGGRFQIQEGKCLVRRVEKNETPNCFLLLQPSQKEYKKNEIVTVHCTDSPFMSIC